MVCPLLLELPFSSCVQKISDASVVICRAHCHFLTRFYYKSLLMIHRHRGGVHVAVVLRWKGWSRILERTHLFLVSQLSAVTVDWTQSRYIHCRPSVNPRKQIIISNAFGSCATLVDGSLRILRTMCSVLGSKVVNQCNPSMFHIMFLR